MTDPYDDDWEPSEAQVYVGGVVRVMDKLCPTCIFRPGNPMQLNEGRVEDMVAECLATDGTIVCHDTLDKDLQAICRGFYIRYADRNWLLRLANFLRIIERV